jgi:predicted PhzF superfamily epimerase YddE/YHI9
MAYVWAQDGDEWPVRFFFTSHGAIVEDPATGSACANLGGFWIATGRPLPMSATLRQGDAVGRPSRLGLRVDEEGGIHVTGAVIELGRGTIDV